MQSLMLLLHFTAESPYLIDKPEVHFLVNISKGKVPDKVDFEDSSLSEKMFISR